MFSTYQDHKDLILRAKRLTSGAALLFVAVYLVYRCQSIDPLAHSLSAPLMLALTAFASGLTGLALILRQPENG